MRLVPDSLAGRTLLVLIGGLFATLIASIAVMIFLDRLLGTDAMRYPRLVDRIAYVAATVNQVPAAVRPELVAELSGTRLQARWGEALEPPSRVARDWRARHFERDLRRALDGFAPSRIAVDHEGGRMRVWTQLDDGTWLALAFGRDWFGPLWFLRFVLAFAVLTTGIALLAVWAARRATIPLSRFAAAAAALGSDVGAPPLEEAGPREIRQAAQAFNAMQGRIRRLVENRTQMLAAIAHDLRTALTRLRLRAEFIEDPEQQRKAVADLDAMSAMLNEALAFARDESAEEPRVETDLAALLRALCTDLADAGQPVRFTGPDRLVCACRPVALERALVNLIDNAVRYGGAAEVTLAAEDDAVEIVVADRGPGIPLEQRERVFAPFFRLEPSRSRETGGMGLGLAVARSIVRRHGGDIALEDRPDGGLLVRVRLPR